MSKRRNTAKKVAKVTDKWNKRGIVKAMWKLFGLIVAVAILFFVLISTGAVGYLPEIEELENPIDKYASQVISSDNELLFTYSLSDENRIFVDYIICRLT